MKFYAISLVVGVMALAACTTKSPTEIVSPPRPNIVFIMSDDHAFQAIGAYGSVINKTPAIDQLADEGMIFHRSYVTNSICGPSRAVLLTGKFSHINGFTDNSSYFDSTQVTFPKILQASGYKTAMIGKWHLRSEPTGFDYWSVLPGQGDYYYPDFITMGKRTRENGYVTDLITEKAIQWMDSAVDEKEPFLLMMHHKGPHRTWMPAIRHLNLFEGEQIPEPATLFDDYATRKGTADQQEMTISNHLMDAYDLFLEVGMNETGDWGDHYLNNQTAKMSEAEIVAFENAYRKENQEFKAHPPSGEERVRWNYQRYIKNYLKVVAAVDESVGQINAYLKEKGLDKNTIVVYTSDQGFYLGEHGWFDKRWMFEESFRTPFIIKYPQMISSGSENGYLVQNIDFAPTLLELAGEVPPKEMQGLSLKPLLKGEQPENWRPALYYHYYEYPGVHAVKRHFGITKDQFKLIHYYHDVDQWELYDLFSDPQELNNLYDHPEYKSIVEGLKRELKELQIQYGDTVKSSFSISP